MQRPEISAIVVSYNACDALKSCLRSLERSSDVNVRVIVIDNASSEQNVDMVRKNFSDAELIVNSTNRGFAAAVNQGITKSHGTVVLMNPDLTVQPSTLSVLHGAFDRYRDVGIVGPKLVSLDGTLQPSVKKFPDWFDLFLILSKVPNFFPGLSRVYNGLTVDYGVEQIVDQVMGACFMIRRSTLDHVGTFDEGFWMWFEEVDFCKRARDKGWKTLFTPRACATHIRGASFSGVPATEKQRALRDSIMHYSTKYFGALRTKMLLPANLMSLVSGPIIDTLQLSKPAKAKDY